MKLLDLWRKPKRARHIAWIASQLPAGSRVHQAMGTDGSWSVESHMLVNLMDAVREGTWAMRAAWGVKEDRPESTERPSATRKRTDAETAKKARLRQGEARLIPALLEAARRERERLMTDGGGVDG